jgi:hypothetical protein
MELNENLHFLSYTLLKVFEKVKKKKKAGVAQSI